MHDRLSGIDESHYEFITENLCILYLNFQWQQIFNNKTTLKKSNRDLSINSTRFVVNFTTCLFIWSPTSDALLS